MSAQGSSGLSRRNILRAAGVVAPGVVAATTVGAKQASATSRVNSRGGPSREPIPEQVPVTQGEIEVPGGHIWYWDTGGEGPAVVLVHAASGSAESWPYQQPVLARAGYRVIAYSRRGHFNSSSFDEEDAPVGAEDLDAVVNHLGIEKFHLVSAALGGYYATDYALLHPERVMSSVVISGFMAIRDPGYLALTGQLRPPEFDALPTYFKELSPSYRAINPEGLASWREIEGRARRADSGYRHRVANEITWSRLATLSPRTLLVTGTSDLYMPPPVLRMIADHINKCSMMVIPEVGHSANWESPSVFNAALLRFLKGHESRHIEVPHQASHRVPRCR